MKLKIINYIQCGSVRKARPLTKPLTKFFRGPQAFCKKAVERVNSEKNILNSSVEWSGFFRKIHMYVHHQIRLFELINMVYFIFNLNAYFSRN